MYVLASASVFKRNDYVLVQYVYDGYIYVCLYPVAIYILYISI